MGSRLSLLAGRIRRRVHAVRNPSSSLGALADDPEPTCKRLAEALAAPQPACATAIEAQRQQCATLDIPEWEDCNGRLERFDVERATAIGSKSAAWGALLHNVVQALQPQRAIEFGTLIGISTAYQASAMPNGRLTSVEMNGRAMALARTHLAALGLDVELFEGTFDEAIDALAPGDRFQYALKDGHHTQAATIDLFQRMLPHMAPGSVFAFDDIRWSWGMRRAWRTIRNHPDVSASVDLFTMGLVVVRPGAGPAKHHRVVIAGT